MVAENRAHPRKRIPLGLYSKTGRLVWKFPYFLSNDLQAMYVDESRVAVFEYKPKGIKEMRDAYFGTLQES
jgi:hypothetical protein